MTLTTLSFEPPTDQQIIDTLRDYGLPGNLALVRRDLISYEGFGDWHVWEVPFTALGERLYRETWDERSN